MYLAYSLLLTLGLVVLIPHFLYKIIVQGKYIAGLRERFGNIDRLENSDHRPIIWLHCVSVGETQAARPLVERLRVEFPHHSIAVSTITTTGQNLARQVFAANVDRVFYFPFDWRWVVRRSLRAINPSVVLIMETELWPNFLRECCAQATPVVLVNGRISRQSFRRYRLVRFFLTRLFANLTLAIMQSESDAERLASLGYGRDRLKTAGNLKFDVHSIQPTTEKTAEFRQRFRIQNEVPLILAASTHAPEEKIVLESLGQLKSKRNVRLMIAPRHPERFREVGNLLEKSGLSWARRSSPSQPEDANADVILLDTIGELPAVYPLATIVFVGGSIIDRGGHNVLEPAAAGNCIVTGYHTHNFQAIVQLLCEADAIVQLPAISIDNANECLTHEFDDLLQNEERRTLLGQRAKLILESNRGAVDRTIEFLRPVFRSYHLSNSNQDSLVATNSPSS